MLTVLMADSVFFRLFRAQFFTGCQSGAVDHQSCIPLVAIAAVFKTDSTYYCSSFQPQAIFCCSCFRCCVHSLKPRVELSRCIGSAHFNYCVLVILLQHQSIQNSLTRQQLSAKKSPTFKKYRSGDEAQSGRLFFLCLGLFFTPSCHSRLSRMVAHYVPAVIIWGCQLRYQLFSPAGHTAQQHTSIVSLLFCCCLFKYDSLSASSPFLLLLWTAPTPPHHRPVFADSVDPVFISLSRVTSLHHHHQCLDSVGGRHLLITKTPCCF